MACFTLCTIDADLLSLSQLVQDPAEAGREAFQRRAWSEARELFEAADANGGLAPEDLELHAEASVLGGKPERFVPLLERAYAGYQSTGNRRRAAQMAIALNHEYQSKLQGAVAAGWLSRATRLLEQEEEAPEHGYLELQRSLLAWKSQDFDSALEHATLAEEIGARHGDRSLEVRALQRRGIALIEKGELEAGRALLDEASAAALSGELDAFSTVAIYCNTIGTCRDLADYARAGEWTETASEWCDRQSASAFPGLCRVNRAEVMRIKGQWDAAEQHAAQASEELKDWCPRVAGAAFYEIGEVRLRRGDLAGAEEAFREAHAYGRNPEPGLSLLRLAQGRTDVAAASIQDALEGNESQLSRARLLPARVEIAVRAGDTKTAREAAGELGEIAVMYGTSALEAAAVAARGSVELAEGNLVEALATLKRAVSRWQDVGAPYETAKARLDLGIAHQKTGNGEAAKLELEAARATFERLGATLDAERTTERVSRRAKRTFMFTDIVRSTDLSRFLGEDVYRNVLRKHDAIVRDAIVASGGEIVKTTGDGFFAMFRDSTTAVDAATAIQRGLRDEGFAGKVRIGLHCGEATEKDGDWEGDAVVIAARVQGAAEGAEILASCDALVGVPTVSTGTRTIEAQGIGALDVVSIDWKS
jgi:class 3 adenylate cyclase